MGNGVKNIMILLSVETSGRYFRNWVGQYSVKNTWYSVCTINFKRIHVNFFKGKHLNTNQRYTEAIIAFKAMPWKPCVIISVVSQSQAHC